MAEGCSHYKGIPGAQNSQCGNIHTEIANRILILDLQGLCPVSKTRDTPPPTWLGFLSFPYKDHYSPIFLRGITHYKLFSQNILVSLFFISNSLQATSGEGLLLLPSTFLLPALFHFEPIILIMTEVQDQYSLPVISGKRKNHTFWSKWELTAKANNSKALGSTPNQHLSLYKTLLPPPPHLTLPAAVIATWKNK